MWSRDACVPCGLPDPPLPYFDVDSAVLITKPTPPVVHHHCHWMGNDITNPSESFLPLGNIGPTPPVNGRFYSVPHSIFINYIFAKWVTHSTPFP